MLTENSNEAANGNVPDPNRHARRQLLKGAKGASEYMDGVVSEREIFHLVETGRLRAVKLGRALYFYADDLDEAFQSRFHAQANG